MNKIEQFVVCQHTGNSKKYLFYSPTYSNIEKIRFSWGTNGSVQGLPRGYTTTPFTTNYFDTAYPIKGQATGALQSRLIS